MINFVNENKDLLFNMNHLQYVPREGETVMWDNSKGIVKHISYDYSDRRRPTEINIYVKDISIVDE